MNTITETVMVVTLVGRFMLGLDTVKLTLTIDECREDFMRKVPPLLEGWHWKQGVCQGQAYEQESGWLENMFVRVGMWGTVVEGSLARYFLGDNLQTLTRGVCIYDKIRQVEREGGIVPEPYVGHNALRIEKRHLKLTKPALRKFGLSSLTAETLSNENFYTSIMEDFVKTYDCITKIQESPQKIEIEMETMTEWNTLGRLLIIKEMGGMSGFMRWLEERQRQGLITAKQKCDFTKGAKKAMSHLGEITEVKCSLDELNVMIKNDLASIIGSADA